MTLSPNLELTRRILVIDDDDDTREAICDALSTEGYSVRDTPDAHAALRWLGEGIPPDLIILDLMMPGLNGWQFLETQRERPFFSDVPVLVVTADGRVGRGGPSPQCAALLPKPLDLDSLLSSVAELVSSHGA